MTVKELASELDMKVLTDDISINNEITSGFCCDLLSWVMSHGKAMGGWITVQTHLNSVAVASLLELTCIIVPEGINVAENVAAKAIEEGIAILSSDLTGYEISGRMYKLGIGS